MVSLAAAPGLASNSGERPNVVLIIGDDQGWGDYGFMGHPDIQTPHLDGLAGQSLVFERGYVVAPLCRPSLASIATGLYPHQHGVVANDVDPKRRAEADRPVRAAFHRLPSMIRMLSEQGYATHQSGKWWEGSFADGGFTHGMTHGDPARGGRHGDAGLKIGRQGLAPLKSFVEDAVAAEMPFFLWYAPFLPHTPHNPPRDLLSKYEAPDRPVNVAKYYAMCEWFDQTCGALLGLLDDRGLRENTVVLFLCDNGWAPVDRSVENPDGWWPGFAPRSKGSPFEGGIRTPMMVSWPGRVEPRRVEDLAASIDVAPTVLAACGIELSPALPGIDLLDSSARATREVIFGASYSIHNMVPGDPQATLQYRWCLTRKWKLLLRSEGVDTTRYKTVHQWDQTAARLFDIAVDEHERTNVIDAHAEVAGQLGVLIEEWLPDPTTSVDEVDDGRSER